MDIADIVRSSRAELERHYRLTAAQRRVLTDIAQCRTEALGGLVERCTSCEYQQPVYHSCRNRHCPKCQALAQDKWIDEQRQRMLDIKHFHVVFTLPAELRPLSAFAPRFMYNALLHAVGRTLLEFGIQNLGATLGATLVLHTWTRELRYHPHAHAIVTAGGLSCDATTFRRVDGNYLFPVKNLACVLRGKLLAVLWDAYRSGVFADFDDFTDPEAFGRLINRLPKQWYAYAKSSFDRGEHVLQYLGRYTHRVGMANSRLLKVTPESVTFRTKGDATETLPPVEFLHRFVQHVLPDGLHKIRHVGLHASETKRTLARELLNQASLSPVTSTWQERLYARTGRDVTHCPKCGGSLRRFPLVKVEPPRPITRCRAPPPTRPTAIAS